MPRHCQGQVSPQPQSRNLVHLDNCRFYHNPEMSFEQVNRSSREGQNQMNLNGSVCLSLAEGVMHDVFVSSIVGGGEFGALLIVSMASIVSWMIGL